jgi:hypothetical protein
VIYPASYDTVILQNATWQRSLRATDNRQALSNVVIVSGFATFVKPCHSLLAGDKVVLTIDSGATVPCGLNINSVYFVIASGLTGDNFKLATTISGAQITVSGTASGQYYVAEPVNLTGYVIDADLIRLEDNVQVASFTCTSPAPSDGEILMTMSPAVSFGIEQGEYGYDLSLTSASNERYYWLTGTATVQRTYSRN